MKPSKPIEPTEPTGPTEPTPAHRPATPDKFRLPLLKFNPLCLSDWHEHGAAHTGHPMVIVFRGVEFLVPPISFQVYVTYDTSHLNREERVDLAHKLFDEIAPMHVAHPVRLDVTFLGPVGRSSSSTDGADASTADYWQQQQDQEQQRRYVSACIKHYLSVWFWQKDYTSWRTRMVRSYSRSGVEGYMMFLITVPVPDWKERDALGMLSFALKKTRKRSREQDQEKTQAKAVPDPWYVWPTGLQAQVMGEEREGFVKRRLAVLRDEIQGVVWKRDATMKGEKDMNYALWMYHQIEGKWFTERWRKVYPTLGKAGSKHKNRDPALKDDLQRARAGTDSS
ncbi:hypothetical protein SLS55_006531 [Diplodia seriata]|uniref:Uncharacterized protein n=1 Tax=Diplodia seriata TaxID=420778 RepID=A0ABR3CH40_9PEZI